MPFLVDDPWGELSAAIIQQAIEDWRKRKLSETYELLEFFYSDWFEELSALCGMNAEYLRVLIFDPKKREKMFRPSEGNRV